MTNGGYSEYINIGEQNPHLRVSELTNLQIGDVDVDENIIYIHSGKGDKDRIVVMPQYLLYKPYIPTIT